MEDKWFVFLEGDVLQIHRSWTGHCIYRAEIETSGETYRIQKAEVNRCSEQYQQRDDNYDIKMLDFLIHRLLLHEAVPFPAPSDLPTKTPPGLYQHHMAGTAHPESAAPRRRWWKFWWGR